MSDVNKSFPEKIKRHLKNRYLQLIKNESPGSFFLELAHYLKYIKETPELDQIIKDCFVNEETNYRKDLINAAENYKKLFLAMFNQILLFQKTKNNEMKKVSTAINAINSSIKKIGDSITRWFPEDFGESILINLDEIFEFMYKNYTLYDDFLNFTNKKYYLIHVKNAFEKLEEKRTAYEVLRHKTTWGAWNYLEAYYISVFKDKALLKKYLQEKNFAILFLPDKEANFFLEHEIETANKILLSEKKDKNNNLLLKYKSFLEIVSNYIFETLDFLSVKKIENKRISYDNNNCELNFYGSKIKFRFSSRQAALLKLIFYNEEEYTDIERRDLLEELGVINKLESLIDKNIIKGNRLVLYNAAKEINNKIFKILKIDDFLIFSTVRAGVNSKYLKDVL